MKKIALLSLLLAISTFSAQADESSPSAVSALNSIIPKLYSSLSSDDMPDWLRRTELSVNFQEDYKPLWWLETVQPLHQTPTSLRNTIFFQGRYAHDTEDDTMNIGLGYRRLTDDENWLLGVNAFYDQAFEHRHERCSLGGEIIGKFMSLHTNFYNAISGRRSYSDGVGVTVTEKALDGWDVEGQVQVPHMPWIYASLKGYEWNGETVADLDGYSCSLLMNITKNLVIEAGQSNDDRGENNFVMIRFTIGGPRYIEHTMVDNFIMYDFFTDRDLKKQTLTKVRRTNDIIIERTRTGSGGLVIGRGN